MDSILERERYKNLISGNIELEILCERYDNAFLDEIVELMTDVVCMKTDFLLIGGAKVPQEVVKSRFLKLDSSHIEYLIESMKKNTTKVRNIKNYLLTALYNSYSTIEYYYLAEVNHDLMAGGMR